MLKIIQNSLIALGLIGVMTVAVPTGVSYAQAASDACEGIKLIDPTAKCDDAAGGQNAFSSVLRTVINLFSIVVGAVSVIMIIIGGFRYVISGGDSNSTKAAKDTILYAVIGLVVVLFAQVIVRFVISNVNTKPAPAKKTTVISRRA